MISMTECDLETCVTDWVIEYPQALALFRELGIDYCCGGKSLEVACREQRLDVRSVIKTLRQSIEANQNDEND